jgi:hypothetical protein
MTPTFGALKDFHSLTLTCSIICALFDLLVVRSIHFQIYVLGSVVHSRLKLVFDSGQWLLEFPGHSAILASQDICESGQAIDCLG